MIIGMESTKREATSRWVHFTAEERSVLEDSLSLASRCGYTEADNLKRELLEHARREFASEQEGGHPLLRLARGHVNESWEGSSRPAEHYASKDEIAYLRDALRALIMYLGERP